MMIKENTKRALVIGSSVVLIYLVSAGLTYGILEYVVMSDDAGRNSENTQVERELPTTIEAAATLEAEGRKAQGEGRYDEAIAKYEAARQLYLDTDDSGQASAYDALIDTVTREKEAQEKALTGTDLIETGE